MKATARLTWVFVRDVDKASGWRIAPNMATWPQSGMTLCGLAPPTAGWLWVTSDEDKLLVRRAHRDSRDQFTL